MDKMSKYFIEDDKGVMAKKTSKSGKYSEWGQPSGNENVRLLTYMRNNYL